MIQRVATIGGLLLTLSVGAAAATYEVGSGQPYPTLASLPALSAGDIVEINPGTYHEAKRWTSSGAAGNPIVIRGVGAARPIIDANGLTVDGSMPNGRAAFQIEGSHYVVQHLEFCNARNGNNGSGIRVTGSSIDDTVIRDCRIHDNDMGMQSNGNDHLLVDQCELDHNGTSAFSGGSHNVYLFGMSTTFRGCYIHDSLYGQNVKYRGHYLELLYNWIADSSDGEVGIVDDATMTTMANSNVLMVGNVIVSKNRGSQWNAAKFINFGQDGGNAHNGTLYAFNNTFVAGTGSINFLWANASGSAIVARNNVFYGSGTIVMGGVGAVSGSNNWFQGGASVPSSFAANTFGSDPGFANAGARDFHLRAGAACIDLGTGSVTAYDGSGASRSGAPAATYEGLGNLAGRPSAGALDLGAYERAGASVTPLIGTGTGLAGQYWSNQLATFTGAATLTRTDATVNFDWASGSPASSVTADHFTARWTGQVQAETSETYTFTTTSDDGVRLWVNGQLLVDAWYGQGPTDHSGAIALSAGQKVSIQMDYYEDGGGAMARLSWSTPTIARQIVPASQLYPATVAGGANGTGLTAQYWSNQLATFTGSPTLTRTDATVNFDWGNGAPDASITADHFTARWTGQVQAPTSGTYTFTTTGDDGIRLWVNGALIVDAWYDQGPTDHSGAIALTAGQKISIQMDFYENGGGATAKLSWSSATIARQIVPQSALYPTAGAATPSTTGSFADGDVGTPAIAGSATSANGTWTVKGSGADIWGNADAFHFVSQALSGDGQITARVVSQDNTDGWAKAGVMIRTSTTAGSAYACCAVTPANGIAFQRRLAAGDTSWHTSGAAARAPYWVRLARVGTTITASQSVDGVTWNAIGSQTIDLGANALIGLAVTSHNDGALCTAVFDNVVVTAAPTGNG